MAWIEKKQRADGGLSARVVWRYGGARDGAYQSETFSAGSDAQNLARAEGFKKMVDAAGQRWPDGWVRGEGFVRPPGEADPLKLPVSASATSGTWQSWPRCRFAGSLSSPSRSRRSPRPICAPG